MRTVLTPLFIKHGTIALACALFMFCALPARAGNWEFVPTLAETGQWQSNALMSRADPLKLYGSTTTAGLMIQNKTPTTSLAFGGSALQNIFNESDFNSTDFHALIQAQKRAMRWGAALKTSGTYDTTRTSEITNLGIIDTKAVRHWGYSSSPELSFHPNATNTLAASVSYSISRYDDNAYTNYNIIGTQTSWTNQLTPNTSSLLLLKARRYQTQNNADETVDSIGPNLGFNVTLNKRLAARMMAGLEASKQEGENITNPSWKWSTVFSGGLNFKGEQDILDVSVAREQQPYANGTSSLLTSLSINENHAINPLFSFVVGARYAYADQPSSSSSSLENQISGSAGLVYHATQEVDLSAKYRYREESYRNTTEKAVDNLGTLSIQYRPNISGAR